MLKKLTLFTILNLCVVNFSFAEEKPISLKILPNSSSIKFIANQAGTSIKGEFKDFSADIKFHPKALDKSSAKVIINMPNFIISDNEEAQSTLKQKDWFNITTFPIANFTAESFTFIKDKTYEAKGNLTIKGKTQQITLEFELVEFNNKSAHITGNTTIKRSNFDIGDKNTTDIKDEVKVDIDIKATAN